MSDTINITWQPNWDKTHADNPEAAKAYYAVKNTGGSEADARLTFLMREHPDAKITQTGPQTYTLELHALGKVATKVNVDTVDLATLILTTLSNRYDVLDKQIRDDAKQINVKANEANNVIAAIDKANLHVSDSGNMDASSVKIEYADPNDPSKTKLMSVKDYMEQQGIPGIPGGDSWAKKDWQAAVTALKNYQTTLTSMTSQMQTEMNAAYNKLQGVLAVDGYVPVQLASDVVADHQQDVTRRPDMSAQTATAHEPSDLDTILDAIGQFSVDEMVQMTTDFAENGLTMAELKNISREELEAVYNISYNAYNSGRYERSEKTFQFLCYFDHLVKKNWMGLGASRQMRKDYANAVDAYTFAYLLDDKDPLPPLHAADCHIALGNRDAALSGLNTAIDLAGNEDQHAAVRARAEALLELLNQPEHGGEGERP